MQHAGKKNYIMLYTFYLLERKDINVTYIKHARKNERIKKLSVLYTDGHHLPLVKQLLAAKNCTKSLIQYGNWVQIG